MNYRLARDVRARSAGAAARLARPVRRLVSRHRVAELAAARSHDERDQLLRAWSSRLVSALDIRVKAVGLHNVGPGPFLVVSLHEGMVDVPVLIDQLDLPLTFVARSSLDDELPIAGLLRASGQIVINPESASSLRTILRETSQLAAQGRSVAVFPQGSVLGIEAAFQLGSFVVADRLGLPVLPVALWGSHAVWRYPFSPDVELGREVRLEVLPPRTVASRREFRAMEKELKAVALRGAGSGPRRYVPQRDGYWDGYNFDIDPDFAELAAVFADRPRTRVA